MIRCKNCHWSMTWSEQRVQYGRLVRKGIKPENIKAIMPRCQKCVTKWMKENTG